MTYKELLKQEEHDYAAFVSLYSENENVIPKAKTMIKRHWMIIQAIKKQVPARVEIKISKAGAVAYCPVCGTMLSITGDKTGDYCEKCGQALDWGNRKNDIKL